MPVGVLRSRRTKAFEADTGLEFDFFLAEQLHMTVGELRATMTGEEWIRWQVYYGRKAQRKQMEASRAAYDRR